MLEQSIWAIVIFTSFFLFVRQTFSAPRKRCLGELAAPYRGRKIFDHPLSQPWTHLMLLCRSRTECCIFLPWGSCCQSFPCPTLCSGELPSPGSPRVAGRCGCGNSSSAFSWLHMAQPQLALGGSSQSTQPSWLGWALGYSMGLSVWRLTQDAVWSLPDEPLATSRKKERRNVGRFLLCFKPPLYQQMWRSERSESVLFNSSHKNRLGALHETVAEIPKAQGISPAQSPTIT